MVREKVIRWKRKDERKYEARSKVMSYAVMNCPLCNEPYRTKLGLRHHLNKDHTLQECENFLKKQ